MVEPEEQELTAKRSGRSGWSKEDCEGGSGQWRVEGGQLWRVWFNQWWKPGEHDKLKVARKIVEATSSKMERIRQRFKWCIRPLAVVRVFLPGQVGCSLNGEAMVESGMLVGKGPESKKIGPLCPGVFDMGKERKFLAKLIVVVIVALGEFHGLKYVGFETVLTQY
mmetsp:Transcript_15987/g.33989  ORF Transcript_15987/g.33989 Transcript_15987/m.33989 type:complete len:166 (-) Transcript_15987:217-714(-)